MRLDALCTPAAFSLTASGWSRQQIEAAIEWLIDLLDRQDGAPPYPSADTGDADRLMEDACEMQNPSPSEMGPLPTTATQAASPCEEELGRA